MTWHGFVWRMPPVGASELLNITVGTQSISPLYWAIESGSLNTAKAMLEDLLSSHYRTASGLKRS